MCAADDVHAVHDGDDHRPDRPVHADRLVDGLSLVSADDLTHAIALPEHEDAVADPSLRSVDGQDCGARGAQVLVQWLDGKELLAVECGVLDGHDDRSSDICEQHRNASSPTPPPPASLLSRSSRLGRQCPVACPPSDCNVTAVFAVVLGLCSLAVGPLVGSLLRRHVALADAVDGFIVVTVTGLVVLHVLPQSVALGGVVALPVALGGVLVPAYLHRFDAAQRPATWRGSRQVLATTLLLLAAFGHALLDGVALIDGGHGAAHERGHDLDATGGVSALALAVLLHRLPYGLALWVVGRERLGLARTLAVLGALAAGTIVGAIVGDQLVSPSTARGFALVQAFAAGAILHVLLEAPAVGSSSSPRASFVGVALGVAVLVVLTRTHPVLAVVVDELAFAPVFVLLASRLAPALLVGLLLVLALALLQKRVRPVLPAHRAPSSLALAGVLLAAWLSQCACRVGATWEALLRRRAGLAGAAAFLVAAPHLEIVQTLAAMALLGPGLTGARLAGAIVVAVTTGVLVGRFTAGRSDPGAAIGAGVEVASAHVSPSAALEASVFHLAPWVLVGLVAAAFLEPLLQANAFAALSGFFGVVVAVALGGPLYLCAPAAVPVAVVLLHKGASPGAVVAFLLTAPAMNVTTFGLLARLISRRASIVFSATFLVGAVVAGVLVDAIATRFELMPPSLHALADTGTTTTQRVALAVWVGIVAWSLARQGARGFLAQILGPLDDAKGGHVHGPHCGHKEHQQPGFGRKVAVARVVVDFAVDDPQRR